MTEINVPPPSTTFLPLLLASCCCCLVRLLEGEEEGGCEVSFAFCPKRRRMKRGGGEEQKADFLLIPLFFRSRTDRWRFFTEDRSFLGRNLWWFFDRQGKVRTVPFCLFAFFFFEKFLLIYETVCFALETKSVGEGDLGAIIAFQGSMFFLLKASFLSQPALC